MMQRNGHLAIPEGSRYMQRLCFHFGKKVESACDEQQGLVTFPWGRCRMQADGAGIRFECEADTPETLQRVVMVIDEHVKLFARKAPLSVQWSSVA